MKDKSEIKYVTAKNIAYQVSHDLYADHSVVLVKRFSIIADTNSVFYSIHSWVSNCQSRVNDEYLPWSRSQCSWIQRDIYLGKNIIICQCNRYFIYAMYWRISSEPMLDFPLHHITSFANIRPTLISRGRGWPQLLRTTECLRSVPAAYPQVALK